MRVVALGLHGAGNSTILFKLKQNELVVTVLTIGFNVEMLDYKNLKLTLWDVGGLPKLRPLWKHYYLNTQAILLFKNVCFGPNWTAARGNSSMPIMAHWLRRAWLSSMAP